MHTFQEYCFKFQKILCLKLICILFICNRIRMSEDTDPDRTGCLMKFKVVSSGLGVVAGCVACPVFAFVYGNLDAALWAAFSVIIVSMVFQLHMLYK